MSKCNYCAFYSLACKNPDWEKYAQDICGELNFWGKKLGKIQIPTIFFGGGTPSLMPIHVFERIMRSVHDNFEPDKDCEITLESNPKTLDGKKLKSFIENGVNRLSVGVQSLNDDDLVFLGRRHNVAEAIDLINMSKEMNLRLSCDFIYGLPNQNVESVIELCKKINDLDLTHVSMYELTIEKNTPFCRMNLNVPDNDTMADMYMAIQKNLSLPRYEVSNYAKPGQECRHNQNIWFGEAYIGVGRAAAGRVNLNSTWYDELGNYERFEEIDTRTRAVEKILTGLRTMRGVKLTDDVKSQIDMNWIKNHKDLVEIENEYLHTTNQGLLILDDITLDLIK